jgi:hypothetical protein
MKLHVKNFLLSVAIQPITLSVVTLTVVTTSVVTTNSRGAVVVAAVIVYHAT